ncbi:MAG: DNA-protecting protein DprA [Candidatus Omnitrophica bacterium]|nr:DNA-protecting protein DprA [Candidatus Omnitrophota bacterium]
MSNLDAYLILNAISGLGPKRIKSLIDHFGSVQKVLSLSHTDLTHVDGISDHVALNWVHFSRDRFLTHEYNLMRSGNIQAVCIEDARYPKYLKEISDAPVVLYVQGSLESLNEPSVAMVGSRRASLYGLGIASRFSFEFAQAGLSVVSGLARGIDTSAHQGALKAGGITIAVLGCGLNTVYPAENAKLAQQVCERGAVISEFPMDTPPASYNFPRRNRIISGLSQGVLVVEAAIKSGALITSDFALEQGREVFAVPGNVGDLSSQGTNLLIQQGAKLAMCVEDVLQDLAPGLRSFVNAQESQSLEASVTLSREEQMVCSSLSDQQIHIDELADKTGMTVVAAALILFKLELKKLVTKLPGQVYQKVK